jgi:hypothetical protein
MCDEKKEIVWCEKVFDMFCVRVRSSLTMTFIVQLIPGIDQRDKFFPSKIQL